MTTLHRIETLIREAALNQERVSAKDLEGMTIVVSRAANQDKRFEFIIGQNEETTYSAGTVHDNGELIVFYWKGMDAKRGDHRVKKLPGGKRKPDFRVTQYVHGNPALMIFGALATPELHEFIRTVMLTNWTGQPGYDLTREAGAFFQGGSSDPQGQFIYIEFWKPEGAKAWVKHVNENFVYES